MRKLSSLVAISLLLLSNGSAFAQPEESAVGDKDRARALGAERFLTKPVDFSRLKEDLSRAVEDSA